MERALVIVLDSVGIGHAPDAADFGDEGANTVGHIRETVAKFAVPTLDAAGLPAAEALAAGRPEPSSDCALAPPPPLPPREIVPSAVANSSPGLHPTRVEYDATTDDEMDRR